MQNSQVQQEVKITAEVVDSQNNAKVSDQESVDLSVPQQALNILKKIYNESFQSNSGKENAKKDQKYLFLLNVLKAVNRSDYVKASSIINKGFEAIYDVCGSKWDDKKLQSLEKSSDAYNAFKALFVLIYNYTLGLVLGQVRSTRENKNDYAALNKFFNDNKKEVSSEDEVNDDRTMVKTSEQQHQIDLDETVIPVNKQGFLGLINEQENTQQQKGIELQKS